MSPSAVRQRRDERSSGSLEPCETSIIEHFLKKKGFKKAPS